MNHHALSTLAGLLSLTAAAHAQCELEQLTAPLEAVPRDFGRALALDGDLLAVGDPLAGPGSPLSGAVFLFRFDETGQANLEATLTPPPGSSGDRFGAALSVDGNRVAIGARFDDDAGGNAGAVHVFVRTDGVWGLEQILSGPYLELGRAVALDGDTLVATAIGTGAVFERNAGGWSLSANLEPPVGTPVADDWGVALALSDGAVAVGAPSAESCLGCADSSGSVALYDLDYSGPTLVQVLSGPTVGARFGTAVALDGDRLAVGAPQGDGSVAGTGSAHTYLRQAGTWTVEATLHAALGQGGDGFGSAVAVDVPWLVVGAPGAGAGGKLDTGAAHPIELGSGGWFERSTLLADERESFEAAGTAVAVDDARAAFSAPDVFGPDPYGGEVFERPLDNGALLYACPANLSIALEERQEIVLRGGAASANQLYFVFGSATGIAPALPIAPGVQLPLVPDAYLELTAREPNSQVHVSTFGFLDADGNATAFLALPKNLDPSTAGLVLAHAAVILDSGAQFGAVELATNAGAVVLQP